MTGGRRHGGHAGKLTTWACTHPVWCRLLQPLVLRAQTAQGQLREGSRFGQRREGLAQLGEEGRQGLGQGPGNSG